MEKKVLGSSATKTPPTKWLARLVIGLVSAVLAACLFSGGFMPGSSPSSDAVMVTGTPGTPMPHIQATVYAKVVESGECVAIAGGCDPSKPCGHRVGASKGAACGDHTCGERDNDPDACGGVQPCYYCCCGCCPDGCGGGGGPDPTPTPTPTPLPAWSGSVRSDSGVPVSGVPIELQGRYDDCAGGTDVQLIASTATNVSGVFSFVAAMPGSPACGWENVAIVEVLPWDTIYQPVSASAPAPGTVASATEILYPWTMSGSFPNNNFVVEFIPVDVTLTADYRYLVLEGRNLPPPDGPLPAQVLRGTYTGPLPLSGRPVDFYVWDGAAWTMYSTYTDAAGNYMIDAGLIGDPLFGTTVLGTWQTYAEVTVTGRGLFATNDVFWRVNWFPAHVTK
jgi:hypothetical protein